VAVIVGRLPDGESGPALSTLRDAVRRIGREALTAAQGARLYAEYDQDYADELLDAARRAWDAASAHPDIIAPDTNSLDPNPGGGPYNDNTLGDEFYWAAAQLYLTTGESQFADAVLSSPYHVGGAEGDIWRAAGFDWGFTAAAGRLDLATVPNELPGRDAVVGSVIEGANRHVATQQGEPFGHAYNPGDYDWGSNHQVMNNAVVIATAYDLTGQDRYRDAALETFDYILGRNALNNSYVKGYGTKYSEKMHNRWLASAGRLPAHPDGMIAGGPNSAIQDPLAQQKLQGCAPQFCYIDEVDSWSTNEMTINWNAPLSWFAAWADDVSGDGGEVVADDCTAVVTVHSNWGAGFMATVRVTAGEAGLSGWKASFDLAPAGFSSGWSADFRTSGSQVTASNASWNGTLAKGASTEFGFLGSGSPPSSIPVTCTAG
jgi:endoglucanase